MRSLLICTVCLCTLQLLAPFPPLQAQWVEDGVGICREVSYQTDCETASDGDGGAIIAWEDYRGGSYYKVYAQKIDAYGDPQWATDGIAVCSALYAQIDPEIVSDGAGGAIITWADYRSGTSYDICAQRIDANGNLLWSASGIAISTATYDQDNPNIMPDGSGGAIITWRDIRNGFDYDIYTQRVDATGSVLWTADGVAICTASGNQQFSELVSDGAGGAIITWQDGRGVDNDIYAQKINAAGAVQWTANGAAVCTATGVQYAPKIASAMLGGAIIAWEDYRGASADIYAQKIDAAGTVQWNASGNAVCTASDQQIIPQIISVSTGGAIVTWSDRRSGSDFDIYAQRLDTNGFTQWIANGIAICAATNHQYLEAAVSTVDDYVIILWKDLRTAADYDMYAQKVDKYSDVQWTVDGVAVTTADNGQIGGRAVAHADGSVIIAWDDERVGPYYDIFAQRLDADGNWGFPAPRITSVRDVPQDEGGFVNIAWDASQHDPTGQITEYSIWRALDISQAALLMDGPALLLESAADMPGTASGPVLRMELLGSEPFYWELIDVHPAYHIDHYSKIVATAFDSTATSNEYHYFQIIAHTQAPTTFYTSAPDSGYSVDNLAPCAPLCLAGEQSFIPEGLELTWAPNTEIDLDKYAIYRDVGPGFTPGPGNFLTEPCDTFYFDGDWRWDSGYCYKVAAVDIHGNESECALLCSEDITGGETPSIPRTSFLAQNVPNPFNPQTTISFGLHEPGHVTLKIYDSAGRLVRVLIDEHRAANRYEVAWDGCDAAGRQIASGVYFYKLSAAAFEKTRKMVLLR